MNEPGPPDSRSERVVPPQHARSHMKKQDVKKSNPLSIGRIATLACLLEVAAPKPGNVHRGADFEDVTLEDFMRSAVALGQAIDQSPEAPVGETIRRAIELTRSLTGTNTNLGIVLLIVPLAKAVSSERRLTRQSLQAVLASLTPDDTRQVFEAIRIASPGGLGTVADGDVTTPGDPTLGLVEAMRAAEDRDLIARQYANGFEQVFDLGVPLLKAGETRFARPSEAIVWAHVTLMAEYPDTLIARKRGLETARKSAALAQQALAHLHDAGGRLYPGQCAA